MLQATQPVKFTDTAAVKSDLKTAPVLKYMYTTILHLHYVSCLEKLEWVYKTSVVWFIVTRCISTLEQVLRQSVSSV